MSMLETFTDSAREFWHDRAVQGDPRATRFYTEHDAYDLTAIQACAPRSGEVRALDLGCGTCVIASPLASELGWRVHAVDYMPEFIAQAIDHPLLTTAVGDARTYEDGGGYDIVLSLAVITYLFDADERLSMYEHCARMLRPGGRLFLKAQFGIEEEVRVDKYSPQLGTHYRAVYPHLRSEAALIADVVGETEVFDPYPAALNPHPNTHFHYIVAER